MKNAIFVEIDTEREQPIMIGKPPEIAPPTTPEETAVMLKNDIACLLEAMCSLIQMADQNSYGKKEDFIKASIDHLNAFLLEVPKPAEDSQPTQSGE